MEGIVERGSVETDCTEDASIEVVPGVMTMGVDGVSDPVCNTGD